jgi:hypothetical protein
MNNFKERAELAPIGTEELEEMLTYFDKPTDRP